ncbi:MAG: thiamine-phosphate kinase [Porticoccaceae bacterium]
MPIDEFGLIETFFRRPVTPAAGVLAGIGDDCALLDGGGAALAVTTDTLVADIHFPAHAAAFDIGQRALRVNLSDLAAMGATPCWFLLALTLPAADADWLRAFSAGLFAVADAHACALVGGDTTRGPLAVTITALGQVPASGALRRAGAGVGDRVFVTGELGGAAAALAQMTDMGACSAADATLNARYWYPEPRVREGMTLRGIASAAIDISDGLVADLGHLARASGVGAELELEQIPLCAAAVARSGAGRARDWALGGGDDYELCFTVPPARLAALDAAVRAGHLRALPIGRLVPGAGVSARDGAGQNVVLARTGYRHF